MALDGARGETFDGSENFAGSFLPVKRFWVFVMGLHEIFDGVNEGGDALMAPALDLTLGEQGEPTFDLV